MSVQFNLKRTDVFVVGRVANQHVQSQNTLVPFVNEVYPDGHRLMADNDPKHTSIHAREWQVENSINWWRTPAESPDLNPIENLWHELKEYIRREVKPTKKEELVNGIKAFWKTIDVRKCCKYIRHLKSDSKGDRIEVRSYWILVGGTHVKK